MISVRQEMVSFLFEGKRSAKLDRTSFPGQITRGEARSQIQAKVFDT